MTSANHRAGQLSSLPLSASNDNRPTLCRPIFILGSHKSGTTLLRSLLDGHPDLFVAPLETEYFLHAGAWVDYPLRKTLPTSRDWPAICRCLRNAVHHQNEGGDRYGDGVLSRKYDLEMLEQYLLQNRPESHAEGFSVYLSSLHRSLGLGELRPELRLVEKSVMNHEFACYLHAMYPDAVFLHVIRNPYATMVALRKSRQKRSGRVPLLRNLADTVLSSYYHFSRNLALLPNYFKVSYEELVRDASSAMQAVCRNAGISYRSELESPSLLNQPWEGNSSSGVNFQGISQAPLEEWKKYISPLEVTLITSRFRSLIEEHGYEKLSPSRSNWKPLKNEGCRTYVANRIQLLGLPKTST